MQVPTQENLKKESKMHPNSKAGLAGTFGVSIGTVKVPNGTFQVPIGTNLGLGPRALRSG